MKVTLTATLEGKVKLDATAEVITFRDLDKLGKKLQAQVAGVRKALPDMLDKPVEKVHVTTE
jgi:hypothetical protein